MRIEKESISLDNICSGDVIVTDRDCYMLSLEKDSLVSLNNGSVLSLKHGSILVTIDSFSETITEIIPNNNLVLRREN